MKKPQTASFIVCLNGFPAPDINFTPKNSNIRGKTKLPHLPKVKFTSAQAIDDPNCFKGFSISA